MRQAAVVEQDFLDDEGSHRLAKLGSAFHDAKAERDDFSLKKETDNLWIVDLHESSDDAQRS